MRFGPLGRLYGSYIHRLVRASAHREQSFGTFFLRNRPELELMSLLLGRNATTVSIAVLACSKGAEVYSIMWTLRSLIPHSEIRLHAVDISEEILSFAAEGAYSLESDDTSRAGAHHEVMKSGVSWNTTRDQSAPIFERMRSDELCSMFDFEGRSARVKEWLKQGIVWHRGDAADPETVDSLGPQDIVVANRFLCHMQPAAAEKCLRNLSGLVKPGGYLFVSGVDLDVRTRVARSMAWKPVGDLMQEIHEGDVSLRRGWPLEYWGLEPLTKARRDWRIRYTSVFQIGRSS